MISRKCSSLAATSLLALVAAMGPVPCAHATVPQAQDRGIADPARMITVTVHVRPRDKAALGRAVDALYDPASPSFRQWLSDAALQRFAAPTWQRNAVRDALTRQGLTILGTDRNGFTIRARGAMGDVARAFQTEIHEFTRGASQYRAPIAAPHLAGAADAFIDTVSGLESHTVRPTYLRAIDLRTGKPYPAKTAAAVEAAGGLKSIITDQALSAPQTVTYTTPDAALPTATYSGITYNANPNLIVDFTAKQLQKAYHLPQAYAAGLDGTGQTIVLLEAYGYPTIQDDANEFSKLNGLPPLTSANFSIVYPEGTPNPALGALTGWNLEIALDVQWAHAIAPGANILVVATNGQDSEDFQYSMQYIVDNKLGTAVSDSWEEDQDISAGPAEQQSFENILITAAAKGLSFQFSTGDDGDGGLGTPIGAPGVPAVCPHAVAVGGTAILNDPSGHGFLPTGWGDSFALIDSDGPLDPLLIGFAGGGGGGQSVYWPKPSWQAKLPGLGRETPDISALGDPYTGVPIVLTEDGVQSVDPDIGGTSLSSPIFTAIWTIAQQKAGHALGQASPTIARLKTGVTDVVPLTSADNVTGSITDTNGTTTYSTAQIFAPLLSPGPANTVFLATLWDQPEFEEGLAFAFGLDSSLTIGKGWDNATGYGTPDGLDFITAAAK